MLVLDGSDHLESARAAAFALCEAGAIATVHGEPRPILVGDVRWLDEDALLFFTAYGDMPADAHLLRFDAAVINDGGSITFMHDGLVAGSLHRIEDADVDDTADYRIAWQLWQQVAPLHGRVIERCYQAIQRRDER